jgi:DNA polymerase family A
VTALLERLGAFPKTIVHLDFETFYSADYTLRKLTTEAYVRDERFQVIGVGVRVGSASAVWLEEWEFRAWAERVDWARCAVNAHHAQFDGFILAERYGIRPAFWFCTMSLGRVLHGEGGLDKRAHRFGIGAKTEGALEGVKGKRREDLTQAQWLAFGAYCRNDVDLSADLLKRMGPGFPKLELWLIDMTVRMFVEPVFGADLDLLRSALTDEREKKRALLVRIAEQEGITVKPGEDPLEAARTVLSSSEKFAALLESLGEEPPMKLNPKGELIPAFAKSDPGMQALLEHPRDDLRFLAEARLAVKSTIIETRTERMIGIAQRGKVPFYLKYCGAHTHRWSGGDKMNPQNFNRGGALRNAVLAPEGHELVVSDSGQIEARVVAWLAGESTVLDAFRRNDATGGDFYSDVGSQFFGKPLSKKETPIERQIAKAMVLGLGFGMGWLKFALELLKGLLGADPVQFTSADALKFGVDVGAFEARRAGFDEGTCGERVRQAITNGARLPYLELLTHCAVADHFVRLYRGKNAKIAALWKASEQILTVMEDPEGDPLAVRMEYRGLKVRRHAIVKPSGLVLRYPALRKTPHGFKYLGGKSGREMVKIYGGLLTENLVQSLARDVVAEQALQVRADGYRVATTTHDEIVAVVPSELAPTCLEQMIAHMRVAPSWCADLPLNAEGGTAKRYGDAK